MALSDARIALQNPWWTSGDWTTGDPHLRRLSRRPTRLPAPLVDAIDLTDAAIHTVRGPRQVGKSTDLKLIAERALAAEYSPRSIIYLALDLLEDQPLEEVARTVERAKSLAAGSQQRTLILLDEVTVLGKWQTAIKALWDHGLIDDDVVVCTGSSATDLARGAAERLPGRREAGLDHLVLPQSFASFARALDSDIPPSPAHTLETLLDRAGLADLREIGAYGPRLDELLDVFLRFGGLPAAVAEAIDGARGPSDSVRNIMWDSLVREVQRKGASMPATEALLERVLLSLGSKTNWSQMAKEMQVGLGRRRKTDYRALRDYVEFLADGYFVFITYFWRRKADTNAVSKDKKVYFADPLLHAVAHDHAPGLARDTPALVENAVGMALYRRYEPPRRLIESFSAPDEIHSWATDEGREIDFVCGPKSSIDAIEVKYRARIDRRTAAALARAFPGRPVAVATKDEFATTDRYALVPASWLLWALG